MFRFFEHTGDVGVDLAASSAAELFAEAARALRATITDAPDIRAVQVLQIALQADALDLLLVDWLSELLYHFEVRGFLSARTELSLVRLGQHWQLTADVHGEPSAATRVPIKVLVKAVTYHALAVEQRGSGWRGRVVFDI